MSKPISIKAKLSIHRCSDGTITIEIEDDTPGITFLRGSISAENFANAVTGLSCQEFCSCELRALQNINKTREVKEEVVRYNYSYGKSEEQRIKAKKQAVAAFEVDGWEARLDDLGNHHRSTSNGYRVTFIRFV